MPKENPAAFRTIEISWPTDVTNENREELASLRRKGLSPAVSAALVVLEETRHLERTLDKRLAAERKQTPPNRSAILLDPVIPLKGYEILANRLIAAMKWGPYEDQEPIKPLWNFNELEIFSQLVLALDHPNLHHDAQWVLELSNMITTFKERGGGSELKFVDHCRVKEEQLLAIATPELRTLFLNGLGRGHHRFHQFHNAAQEVGLS